MSIKIQKVTDESFKKYGRVLTSDYDVAELIGEMGKTPCPDDVIYIPSDPELEKLAIMKDFTDSLYGGLPIQIGYCNGHNNRLNAVEYHRSSEVNVACTDVILLIGSEQDIEDDFTYDTSKIEAFLLPAGTVAAMVILHEMSTSKREYPFANRVEEYLFALGIMLLFILLGHFLSMRQLKRWNLAEAGRTME